MVRRNIASMDVPAISARPLATRLDVAPEQLEMPSARASPVEVIHPGTVTLLRALKARQAANRLAAGTAWRESVYVVVNALGEPLRPELYSDTFRRLCDAANVPAIRLHSCRHSLAFWLHSLGVAPADAAALLGHTVEVHLSTYLPDSGSAGIAAAALGKAGALGVSAV